MFGHRLNGLDLPQHLLCLWTPSRNFLIIQTMCFKKFHLTHPHHLFEKCPNSSGKCSSRSLYWGYSPSNLFIYQARESSPVQAGFLTPSFCRKCNLWSFCFVGRTRVGFLCIACMENTKSEDKSIFHPVKLLNTLFLQESNAQKDKGIKTKVS